MWHRANILIIASILKIRTKIHNVIWMLWSTWYNLTRRNVKPFVQAYKYRPREVPGGNNTCEKTGVFIYYEWSIPSHKCLELKIFQILDSEIFGCT